MIKRDTASPPPSNIPAKRAARMLSSQRGNRWLGGIEASGTTIGTGKKEKQEIPKRRSTPKERKSRIRNTLEKQPMTRKERKRKSSSRPKREAPGGKDEGEKG